MVKLSEEISQCRPRALIGLSVGAIRRFSVSMMSVGMVDLKLSLLDRYLRRVMPTMLSKSQSSVLIRTASATVDAPDR